MRGKAVNLSRFEQNECLIASLWKGDLCFEPHTRTRFVLLPRVQEKYWSCELWLNNVPCDYTSNGDKNLGRILRNLAIFRSNSVLSFEAIKKNKKVVEIKWEQETRGLSNFVIDVLYLKCMINVSLLPSSM